MPQINKGTTFSTGDVVTADSLNGLVSNATLTHEAITGQSQAGGVSTADSILVAQGSNPSFLRKASVAQVLANVDLSGVIKANGSVPMSAQLKLTSTTQIDSLDAASKGYVDNAIVQNALNPALFVTRTGSSMSGNLTMTSTSTVVLARDPIAPLEATTLQYVSSQIATLSSQSIQALTDHKNDKANPHDVNKTQVGLGLYPDDPTLLTLSTATISELSKKLNLTGGTLTGRLGLTTDSFTPLTPQEAVPLQYVQTQDALKVAKSGDTMTGLLTLQTGGIATLMPSGQYAIANRDYVDKSVAFPKCVASAYFNTAIPPASASSKSLYLSVLGSRTAGSGTMTISYASLSSEYKSTTSPFFVAGQYIGTDTVTGLAARLYKIESVNYTNNSFTITTTETTAFNSVVLLSLVFDGTKTLEGSRNFNVKSIYLNTSSVSKYYINYIRDIVTGSKVNSSPSKIYSAVPSGGSIIYNVDYYWLLFCDDNGRPNYTHNQDTVEGFGATSMGINCGFFLNYANGANYTAVYGCSFSISCLT